MNVSCFSVFPCFTQIFSPLPTPKVFISVDETDSTPKGPDDPSFTVVSADMPAAVAAVEPQSVEFDSPDSGLPSSRNYSVASGILSSIDDGQSVSFEDGAEEEASADSERTDPDTPHLQKAKSVVLQSQDSVSEEQLCSQVDYLMDVASVCAASYTVGHNISIVISLHSIALLAKTCSFSDGI